MGVNVDGARSAHFRFANNIVLFADSITDHVQLLAELDSDSSKLGLIIIKTSNEGNESRSPNNNKWTRDRKSTIICLSGQLM